MESRKIEIRSPKVSNIMSKIPKGLTFAAIVIYVVVIFILLTVIDITGIIDLGAIVKNVLPYR